MIEFIPSVRVPLDEEQQKVVDYEGNLFVESGPGSGKTRMLTEKARKVFNRGESTLCLCFTRSAAKEMQNRVVGLPATTIHSYCCGVVGWDEKWSYSGLLYRYLQYKEKETFENVLVDEVQDLNEMEADVVLAMVGKNLFAVGDPYQSIYGFQGALGPKISGLLAARGCRRVPLHNNYRSTPEIVQKLNRLYPRALISKGIKDNGLTAILCRSNDNVFLVSKTLKNLNIPHRVRLAEGLSKDREYDVIGTSNLRVMTIHQSKGSEFTNVIIFDWRPYGEQEEYRCYYVACSRASKELVEIPNIIRLVRYLVK